MKYVMLHGWASSRASWLPILFHLPDSHPHFIDLPGHAGASDQITIADQLSSIEKPYILCAWSLGSLLALEYALSHPLKLTGLILFSPIACFIAHDNWKHAMPMAVFEQFERRFFKKPQPDFSYFRLLAASGTLQPEKEAEKLAQLDNTLAEPSLLGLRTGLDQLKTKDVTDKLHQIKIPVLLISGSQDALVPIHSVKDISEQLPNAEYHALDHVGHLPHIVAPEPCVNIILHWMQNVIV